MASRSTWARARLPPSWQKEVDDFPDYYAEYFKKYSADREPAAAHLSAPGPISYVGQELLQTDIDNLKAGHRRRYDVADVFMPSTGPSGFGRNEYYATHEEYLARRGRGHARGVPGHRRRRVHPPDRRPVPDRPAERPRRMEPEERDAPGVGPRRGAQPRASATSRPRASATTRATASTTARA